MISTPTPTTAAVYQQAYDTASFPPSGDDLALTPAGALLGTYADAYADVVLDAAGDEAAQEAGATNVLRNLARVAAVLPGPAGGVGRGLNAVSVFTEMLQQPGAVSGALAELEQDNRGNVGDLRSAGLTGWFDAAVDAGPAGSGFVDGVRAFEAYANADRPAGHPVIDLVVDSPSGPRLVDPAALEPGLVRDVTMARLNELATGVSSDGSRVPNEHGGGVAGVLADPLSQLNEGYLTATNSDNS